MASVLTCQIRRIFSCIPPQAVFLDSGKSRGSISRLGRPASYCDCVCGWLHYRVTVSSGPCIFGDPSEEQRLLTSCGKTSVLLLARNMTLARSGLIACILHADQPIAAGGPGSSEISIFSTSSYLMNSESTRGKYTYLDHNASFAAGSVRGGCRKAA